MRQVRIDDEGSEQQYAEVLIEGVPVTGVVDSGAEITIMNGKLFARTAAVARLKKSQLKPPDRIPKTYDRRVFSLDGRVDLDISFNGITMRTPIYIKVEAADKLLLGEGVCRQFKIITYHPLVSSKKTRKENKVRPMPSVKPHNVGGEAAVSGCRPKGSAILEEGNNQQEVEKTQKKPEVKCHGH